MAGIPRPISETEIVNSRDPHDRVKGLIVRPAQALGGPHVVAPTRRSRRQQVSSGDRDYAVTGKGISDTGESRLARSRCPSFVTQLN